MPQWPRRLRPQQKRGLRYRALRLMLTLSWKKRPPSTSSLPKRKKSCRAVPLRAAATTQLTLRLTLTRLLPQMPHRRRRHELTTTARSTSLPPIAPMLNFQLMTSLLPARRHQ